MQTVKLFLWWRTDDFLYAATTCHSSDKFSVYFRYQCMMCSRNFRHPALLDDHMNRSHMGLTGVTPQFPATSDSGQTSTSALQQLSQSLPLPPGTDNSSMDTITDPVLPKITSVSSLQHLAPTASGPLTTAASTSNVPFAQGSPMGPVFRHQSPSTSRTPQSRPPGSANRVSFLFY